MIVYMISPIDAWFGWTPIKKAVSPPETSDEFSYNGAAEIREALTRARRLAKHLLDEEWDHVRQGPFFCPLPITDPGATAFLMAWKMDNNGMTFVASPYRLPWLEEGAFNWVDDEDLRPAKTRPERHVGREGYGQEVLRRIRIK